MYRIQYGAAIYMYPKPIWRYRIINTIFNSTLDYFFGQIHAPATLPNPGNLYIFNGRDRLISPVCFLFAMQQQDFHSPHKHSSSYHQFVLADKHYWERSLIHSAKRCPRTSSEDEFCGRIFLLVHRWTTQCHNLMWHRFFLVSLCLQANAHLVPQFPSCYYRPLM